MSKYLSMTGVVSQILPGSGDGAEEGCSLTLTLQTYYQGTVLFSFTGDTYVADNETIYPGDQITAFYNGELPVELSYPPSYCAVLLAKSAGRQFYLGEFDSNLLSADGSLQLSVSPDTKIVLPNGQTFTGIIAGRTVLAEYQASTRSVPAQAVPNRLIVFC